MVHVKMKLEEKEIGSAGLAQSRDWMDRVAGWQGR